jgi:hypothetical protein
LERNNRRMLYKRGTKRLCYKKKAAILGEKNMRNSRNTEIDELLADW